MKSGALIGFGYWGQTLAKTFKQIRPSLRLYIFDNSLKVRKTALKNGFPICSSLEEILESKEISFLIIATPPVTHYSLVKKGLNSNKNILVEKPFGRSTENKDSLFKLARQKKRVLMVDYTYLYSPGFQALKESLKNSKMISYESLRLNSELARTDINVVDDLMIHDLSMLLEIAPSKPLHCSCYSIDHKFKTEQQAFAFIYGNRWQASIFSSRVWTNKTRTVIVRSSKKTLCFEEKNKQTYLGDVIPTKAGISAIPKNSNGSVIVIKNKTSLELMFEEFFKRIESQIYNKDFQRYCKITNLLKALNQSIKQNGKDIKIHWKF